ncbi:hypothetical protein Aduo_011475 [Ancylostoma duodenale]
MVPFLFYMAIVGIAVCSPQSNTFMNTTIPEFKEIGQQLYSSIMETLFDTAATKKQKFEKLGMLANKSVEATKKALGESTVAVDFIDWIVNQAKTASPKVKEAILKVFDMTGDDSFLKKTSEIET